MYLIISNNNEPGTLETLPKTDGLTILKETEFLNSDIQLDDATTYAITTEGVIGSVNKKTISETKLKATVLLKDKFLFRQTIAGLFSDYQFQSIKISDLPSLQVTNKMAVKPRKGFFGTGIRFIDRHSDLEKIQNEILAEITNNRKTFVNADNILSSEELLVEDYIGGSEYAVDMFYDRKGKPQLLNVYEHPTPKNEAYIHALYCSSRRTYKKIAPKAIDIFTKLNRILNVKNYIIHAEFKLDNDKFIPIEMNPLRLGGMGLGNMCYYSQGVNPYEYLIKGEAPDWQTIWNKNEHQDAVYNFLIAYNGATVDVNKTKPNISKLKQDLGEILGETHFDYQKNLVFGIFISRESEETMKNLKKIEFNDYFEEIELPGSKANPAQ